MDDRSVNIGEQGEEAAGPTDAEAAIEKLDAHCQALLTVIPCGVRGVGAAREFIAALPAAIRLGWSNLTLSAPGLFRMFHGAGLISRVPSDCDMPAALRLVASVTGLVTRRSERRWTVWLACACDPEHPLGASIRQSVSRAMLDRPSTLDSSRAATPLITERDQLAEELRATNELQASLRGEHALVAEELRTTNEELTSLRVERDQLAEELRMCKESLPKLQVERDQLAEKLCICKESVARERDNAARAKNERALLARERDTLQAASNSATEEIKALRNDLKSANGNLARARRAERASAAQLKSERDAHKQELATVRQEQLEARKEAASLARSHAGECADLRERIRALMIETEQLEGRTVKIKEDCDRESRRRELLEEIVGEVQALFGLPSFDPEQPYGIIDALILWNSVRDRTVEQFLAKCARELDLAVARGAKALIVERMTRQGLSAEDVEQFLRRRPELLESKIHEKLEEIRSRLSEEGVKLPRVWVKLDDLDVE